MELKLHSFFYEVVGPIGLKELSVRIQSCWCLQNHEGSAFLASVIAPIVPCYIIHHK